MPINANALARLGAGSIDYEYRVYVAGPRGSVAEQDIVEGQPYTNFPATALTASFSPIAGTMSVASTAAFPSSGGLYLSPTSSLGKFVTYTGKTSTTFTGIRQEVATASPVATTYPSGTPVTVWREITAKVQTVEFAESMDEVESTWNLSLSGTDYDSVLMAQNNMIMLVTRFYPHPGNPSNWSDWRVFCVGYITPSSISDDYQRGARWNLSATGINLYAGATDAEARRYGRANLLLNSSTSASPHLVDSTVIGHPGEVVGRQSMESDKAVDGSTSTAYCSIAIPQIVQQWSQPVHIGDPNSNLPVPAGGADGIWIGEVGFGPIGTGDEGAYFVIWSTKDVAMKHNSIGNRNSTLPGPTDNGNTIFTKDNDNIPTVPSKGRVILCYSREIFESWAGDVDAEVFEWRVLNPNFTLRRQGDVLWFVSNHTGIQTTQITWGDMATTGLPAIGEGQALYIPLDGATKIDSNFALTNAPIPGRNSRASTHVYLSVEIPPLAATVAVGMTNVSPSNGGAITVSPSTAGFNQGGGVVLIDSERIAYTGATATTLTGVTRGNGGTTPATHLVGASVYPYEGGLAKTQDFIDNIAFKRNSVLDNGTLVTPADFSVWISQQTSPTYPTTSDPADVAWQSDWVRISTASGHPGPFWQTPPWAGSRARHAMILIERMTNNGRALVNEFQAMRKGSHDPSPTNLSTIGDVFREILVSDLGLDPSQITISNVNIPVGDDLQSTRGKLMARLRELAALVGATVIYGRDNRVYVRPGPWHPLYGLPEIHCALTRELARSVSVTEGKRNTVSQVVLNCRNPSTGETYTVYYPPVPQPLGDVMDVERVIYGGAAEARHLAESIYRQANRQATAQVVLKGHGDGFARSQRVTLTWAMDRAGSMYNAANFIITGLSFSMGADSSGKKSCEWSLTLREYTF